MMRFLNFHQFSMNLWRTAGLPFLLVLTLLLSPDANADESVTAYVDQGLESYETGNFDEALHAFSRAIELDPNNSLIFTYRALVYGSLRDVEALEADINEALRLDDQNAEALELRGALNLLRKELDAAVSDLSAALKIDSLNATAYQRRGQAFFLLRRFKYAVSDFTTAIELDPEGAETFFHRSRAYAGIYEAELALKDLEKALELEPSNLTYRLWRAKSRVFFLEGDQENFEQVVSDLEMVIKARPKEADAYFVRATAYAFACRFEEAIHYQKQALSIVEDNPEQTAKARDYEKLSDFEAHEQGYCMPGFREQ